MCCSDSAFTPASPLRVDLVCMRTDKPQPHVCLCAHRLDNTRGGPFYRAVSWPGLASSILYLLRVCSHVTLYNEASTYSDREITFFPVTSCSTRLDPHKINARCDRRLRQRSDNNVQPLSFKSTYHDPAVQFLYPGRLQSSTSLCWCTVLFIQSSG